MIINNYITSTMINNNTVNIFSHGERNIMYQQYPNLIIREYKLNMRIINKIIILILNYQIQHNIGLIQNLKSLFRKYYKCK